MYEGMSDFEQQRARRIDAFAERLPESERHEFYDILHSNFSDGAYAGIFALFGSTEVVVRAGEFFKKRAIAASNIIDE